MHVTLDEAGSIHCWGIDDGGQTLHMSHPLDDGQVTDAPTTGTYAQIDSGGRLSCAISTEGLLSCWGRYDVQESDADNDGYDVLSDCDDNNTQIHPSAIEICDSIDNN